MGTVLKMAVGLALVCAVTGCGTQMPTAKTQALLNEKVQIGMNRLDVEKTVGFPQRIERVGTTTFFFYTPSWYIPSYYTNSQNPVALVNDKVVGLGRSYYDAIAAGSDKQAISN